jgi:hypothetical protein
VFSVGAAPRPYNEDLSSDEEITIEGVSSVGSHT